MNILGTVLKPDPCLGSRIEMVGTVNTKTLCAGLAAIVVSDGACRGRKVGIEIVVIQLGERAVDRAEAICKHVFTDAIFATASEHLVVDGFLFVTESLVETTTCQAVGELTIGQRPCIIGRHS